MTTGISGVVNESSLPQRIPRYASQDIHNLQSSQVPMIADPVNEAIDESNRRNHIESNQMVYLNEDPGHIAHFQYQNAIGKEGVGISANAIKVISAVQQNTNIKISNGDFFSKINGQSYGKRRFDGMRKLSSFSITREFLPDESCPQDEYVWNEQKIAEREARLLEEIIKIWPIEK